MKRFKRLMLLTLLIAFTLAIFGLSNTTQVGALPSVSITDLPQGKNYLDPNNFEMGTSNFMEIQRLRIKPDTDYVFWVPEILGEMTYVELCSFVYNESGSNIQEIGDCLDTWTSGTVDSLAVNYITFHTHADAYNMTFQVNTGDSQYFDNYGFTDIQLEEGLTPTTYEAYIGVEYPNNNLLPTSEFLFDSSGLGGKIHHLDNYSLDIDVTAFTDYTLSFATSMFYDDTDLIIYVNGTSEYIVDDEQTSNIINNGEEDVFSYTFSSPIDDTITSISIGYNTSIVTVADRFPYSTQLEQGSTPTRISRYVAPIDLMDPVLNGYSGVYLTNVSNPVTVAEIQTNLMAIDDIDGDITADITVTSDAYTGNESVLGDYDVVYSVSDAAGNTSSVTITVRTVDVENPIITLIDGDMTIEYGSVFVDPGYNITDNIDSGLSAVIQGDTVDPDSVGTYVIEYRTTDSSGNVDQAFRTVTVEDTTPAVITLVGDATINIEYGGNYTELGSICDTVTDGNCISIVTGTVNVGVLGTYTINYDYTDNNGNVTTTVTRTVNVIDTVGPVFNGPTEFTYNAGENMTLDLILDNITASDLHDADVTASIVIEEDLYNNQSDVAGTYTVEISAEDSSNNLTIIVLTINIVDNEAPTFYVSSVFFTLEEANSMTQAELKAHFGVS